MKKLWNKGFSLVELIVVITVTGILVGVAAIKYNSNSEYKVNLAARKIIADIRYIQSFAMKNGTEVDFYIVNSPVPPSGCFIATAAYGSAWEPHVNTLRKFRDNYLSGTTMGDRFIVQYQTYGPKIATFINKNPVWKPIVRGALTPLAYVLEMVFGKPAIAGGWGSSPGIPGEPNTYYAKISSSGAYLKNPDTNADFIVKLPDGVAITSATTSISFSSRGMPTGGPFNSSGNNKTLLILNSTMSIVMSRVTGTCWIES
ncbi:MAG: prepilin-type N-terminal cleavage/methylation domain-containing protein [bacterium]|nr:prepilin-type N-terminal cleavage/methylation domain-containing protein [bacterium]